MATTNKGNRIHFHLQVNINPLTSLWLKAFSLSGDIYRLMVKCRWSQRCFRVCDRKSKFMALTNQGNRIYFYLQVNIHP